MSDIDRLTRHLAANFRSFGTPADATTSSAVSGLTNPIMAALPSSPLQFDAGVIIEDVVKAVLMQIHEPTAIMKQTGSDAVRGEIGPGGASLVWRAMVDDLLGVQS